MKIFLAIQPCPNSSDNQINTNIYIINYSFYERKIKLQYTIQKSIQYTGKDLVSNVVFNWSYTLETSLGVASHLTAYLVFYICCFLTQKPVLCQGPILPTSHPFHYHIRSYRSPCWVADQRRWCWMIWRSSSRCCWSTSLERYL